MKKGKRGGKSAIWPILCCQLSITVVSNPPSSMIISEKNFNFKHFLVSLSCGLSRRPSLLAHNNSFGNKCFLSHLVSSPFCSFVTSLYMTRKAKGFFQLAGKVKILWEGYKIWRFFDVYSVKSKQVAYFFSIFCGLFGKPELYLKVTHFLYLSTYILDL